MLLHVFAGSYDVATTIFSARRSTGVAQRGVSATSRSAKSDLATTHAQLRPG